MSFGGREAAAFWDFVRSMDTSGVDQQPQPQNQQGPYGFPFVPAHPSVFTLPCLYGQETWDRGCQGRPATPAPTGSPAEREGAASHSDPGRHGRGGHGRGGRGPQHPRSPPPPPFDMATLIASLSHHPFAQALRSWAEHNGMCPEATGQTSGVTTTGEKGADSTFRPPVDTFNTTTAFVLHVAIPGAKKEDIGVNWDPEKSELHIAGVVHRHGDEEFLKTLSKAERKIGQFERSIKLNKEEVDGDNITAKLEDGILIVTVPKVEKEWTEVKRVDIA